jgi:hypothetical protein
MDPIGGTEPKFLQAAERTEEEAFSSRSVRIVVSNPHSVSIGEIALEARDGKVHVTPSSPHELEIVLHERAPG